MEKRRQLMPASPFALLMILAHPLQKLSPYARALPFGHNNEPRGPVCVGGKERANGQVRHQLALDCTYKIFSSGRHGQV